MTIADQISERAKEEERANNIRGLLQNGVSVELISKSFGLSIQKIEEIIQKIRFSLN
jgi:DNA invertase Pin-like site-specific DNA recombinase